MQVHISAITSPNPSHQKIKNRRRWSELSDSSGDSEEDEILERAGVLLPGAVGTASTSTLNGGAPAAAGGTLSQASSSASLVFTSGQVRLVPNASTSASPSITAASPSHLFPPAPIDLTNVSATGSPMHAQQASPSGSSMSMSTQMDKHLARTSRVAEGGMLIIDSLQIEKLKQQFRDPETGKYDKALELNEFIDAFASVLGKTRKEFKHLFMKVDANSDGSIDWDEFTNFMLMESGSTEMNYEDTGSISFIRSAKLAQTDFTPSSVRKDGESTKTSSAHIPAALTHSTRHTPQPSKKSTFHTGMISKLLYLPAYDRYVTGGRDGMVKFWNANDLSHVKTMKHNCWISDICFMKKSNRVAVCTMDRVITFYDPTTFDVVSRIRDVGSSRPLSSAPTCMDSSAIHNGEEEILLIGDDAGNLLLYRMKSATWHICDGRGGVASCRHHEENTAKNYSEAVTVAKMVGLHEDCITSVKYDSRLGMVITSSLDRTIKQCDINKMTEIGGNTSVTSTANSATTQNNPSSPDSLIGPPVPFGMEDIIRRTFTGHKKGIYSFDYSKKYKFMASCGLERKILLWDPFTCKLISTLTGHLASIQQVVISDEKSLLISLDFLKYIRIWSLRQDHMNLKNIQTIYEVNTHVSGIPPTVNMRHHAAKASVGSSYRPENRISYIHFDPFHQRLISCNCRMTIYHARTLRDHGPKSHKSALVGAMYISHFNQVVSGDTGGTINVWDVDTGLCVFKFETGCKITSMTFDSGKRRLLTGSADGQLRMWNFSNGQGLMEFANSKLSLPISLNKKNATNNEIASVGYIAVEKAFSVSKYVLATGLDRKVTVYLEGDCEKHDALFTMPPSGDHEPRVKKAGPKVATPASARKTTTTTDDSSSSSSTKDVGHKDDILCMVVCGKNHTIATGSYDGSICLWHFDSANFFAKLVPPPSSTNQAIRRAAAAAAEDELHPTSETNTANVTAIQQLNQHRKGVSFLANLAAPPSSKEAKAKAGYTLYAPAANPWEELTPLIERAVEKLVWLDRQEILVSAGADGIIRFWDVGRAVMLCDRLARVGHTRSENILSMKAVETIASNWEQRLALQQHMEFQAIISPTNNNAPINPATTLPTSNSTAALATTATSSVPTVSGTGTPATLAQTQSQAQDAAVAAINAIDAKPPVHYTFLLTGDSLGHLIVWDISQLEFRFEKDFVAATQTKPPSILSGGLRRNSMVTLTTPIPQVRETPVMVHPKEVSIVPVNHWQAHENSACLSIDYLTSYKMVVTGGQDGRVLLWTRRGDLVGMFGQSVQLDGCWDLHDPETYRSTQGVAPYINRSMSESESESEDEKDTHEGATAHNQSPNEEAQKAAKRRSLISDESEPPHNNQRPDRRSRSTLASLYPEPAFDSFYDESPPHTPIEDEGRTRSNTPDAEEQARAAAIAAKNKASTVDSLAALGRQALREKENAARRAAGRPTVEEEAELARQAEEEKQIDFIPALSGRALGGVGSVVNSRRGSTISLGSTASNALNSTIPDGNLILPSNKRASATAGMSLKAILQSRRESTGPGVIVQPSVGNTPEHGSPSLTGRTLAGGGGISTGRNSPGMRHRLPLLNLAGIPSAVNGALHTAPAGASTTGPSGGSGTSSNSKRRPVAPSVPPVAPSPFVPLLQSKEGFEYFQATIFNKPLSAAHPTHNVPPPRTARESPLVNAMFAKDQQFSTQIESDEEQDDFYSNEGGHASDFFQSSRSGSLHHTNSKTARQEEVEARRNKLIFGALLRGRQTNQPMVSDGDDEDEEDGHQSLGLIRGDSNQTSLASLASFRAGAGGANSSKKKKPVQSQRMQGVSASNIRRRLGSVQPATLPSSTALASSKYASNRARSREGAGVVNPTDPLATRSNPTSSTNPSVLGPFSRRPVGRPSPGFLRDYPIVDVPYDSKGRDEMMEQEEFVR